jgi:hypothetical protein
MNTEIRSRARRPKLHLPLFLAAGPPEAPQAPRAPAAFPLSPEQLRRTVAEMIG